MPPHPPCPTCGRPVFPMEDKVGGEMCLQGDLGNIAEASRRALEDIPSTPRNEVARGVLNNILDIAARHQKTPVGA